jgi:hypothetical protein
MPSKCETGCGKAAYFNILGEKKGKFCSGHKDVGMINVLDKLCENGECSGRRATFGLPEQKPTFCNEHKVEGMVNLALKRCLGSNGKKCYVAPIYNIDGETKGIYCFDHKLDGMVNVASKRCENGECKIVAQFNVEGESVGRFCSKHKCEGMIDVKHTRCEFSGCSSSPSYRFETDTHCRFCAIHKLDGMFDAKHRKCTEEGCDKSPSFNYIGENRPLYCNDHKLEDMIDVKHDKCENMGCNLRPIYNTINEKKGKFCVLHKSIEMVDVLSRKCISEWCTTITHNNKYDGHCIYCYINLYPEKPVVRNFKTKEIHIVNHVKNKFPDFTWITDKRVQDGCSKRRPDLLLDMGNQVVVVEIDENQHNSYDCSCENKRLMEISQDIGHRPLVFIRFNPDGYINNKNENKKSCWRSNQLGIFIINKESNKDWSNRLTVLENQIQYWTDNATNKLLEVIHLFYDGFD